MSNIKANIKLVANDPFYSEIQDGKIDVKCAKLLEETLRSAAAQLKMKYPDLVRSILKQAVLGLALEGKIKLPEIGEDEIKNAASGD